MTTTSMCRPSCAAERACARPPALAARRGRLPRDEISDTGHVSVRIRRVTTTRAGGVSKPPFDTFNLGDHVGDDPAAVAANRKRLAAAIGVDDEALIWM